MNGQVIGNAWTVSSNNSANIITSEAGQGVTPFGRQYLEIHGDSIRQNISGLIPNQAYRLDYFATVQSTAQFFGPGSITASIDGVSSVFNYNLSGIHLWGSSSLPWQLRSLEFTASSASAMLTFTGTPVSGFGAIDNVSITAVPEPTSIVVFGLLSSGLLFRIKQRREPAFVVAGN